MTVSTFGVDAESVRRHHFAFMPAFAAGSRPSLATVTEAIAEEAAAMAGALALELVNAASITVDSGAYNTCRRILRLQVAARLARDIPGADSALARSWDGAVRDWYEKLDEGGASFLGDGATATGGFDADGPVSHLSVYNLERDEGASMSSPVNGKLRMDDDM